MKTRTKKSYGIHGLQRYHIQKYLTYLAYVTFDYVATRNVMHVTEGTYIVKTSNLRFS